MKDNAKKPLLSRIFYPLLLVALLLLGIGAGMYFKSAAEPTHHCCDPHCCEHDHNGKPCCPHHDHNLPHTGEANTPPPTAP